MIEFPVGEQKSMSVPQGLVDVEGQRLIVQELKNIGLPELPNDFEWAWTTSRGSLPKRVQRHMYQLGHKLTPDDVCRIGTIGKRHVFETKEYTYDFESTLHWKQGTFGDEGSCFFNGESAQRGILKRNGALAFRLYRSTGRDEPQAITGYARAWVAKIDPDAFVVFNAYGETLLTMGRLLAAKYGLYYRFFNLTVNGRTEYPYLNNGGRAIMVGLHEALRTRDEYDLPWNVDFTCSACSRRATNWSGALDKFGCSRHYYGEDDVYDCDDEVCNDED